MGLFRDLTLSVGVLSSELGLLEVLVKIFPCLCMPAFPCCWVSLVSAWLTLAFSFHLAHPDSFVLARWSLPTPEAWCLRHSPSAGVLELLSPCSGMSELLAPEGMILDVALGRFLTSGLSLPLAEILTAGSLVASVHFSSWPLCWSISCKDLGRVSFFKSCGPGLLL